MRQLLPNGCQLYSDRQVRRARLQRRTLGPAARRQLPALRLGIAAAHCGGVLHVSNEGGQLRLGRCVPRQQRSVRTAWSGCIACSGDVCLCMGAASKLAPMEASTCVPL